MSEPAPPSYDTTIEDTENLASPPTDSGHPQVHPNPSLGPELSYGPNFRVVHNVEAHQQWLGQNTQQFFSQSSLPCGGVSYGSSTIPGNLGNNNMVHGVEAHQQWLDPNTQHMFSQPSLPYGSSTFPGSSDNDSMVHLVEAHQQWLDSNTHLQQNFSQPSLPCGVSYRSLTFPGNSDNYSMVHGVEVHQQWLDSNTQHISSQPSLSCGLGFPGNSDNYVHPDIAGNYESHLMIRMASANDGTENTLPFQIYDANNLHSFRMW